MNERENMKLRSYRHLLLRIVALTVLRCCLMLFYVYLKVSENADFFEVSLGGISVRDSINLLYVVLYALPDFLFCIYVGNIFVKELKDNFLYIFLRTNHRNVWMRKTIGKLLLSIVVYEAFTVVFLWLQKMIFFTDKVVSPRELVNVILFHFFKLFMLVLFSDILLFFFTEVATVYAVFLSLIIPVFITGILYDINGMWNLSVKCIPFNWGNYNYIMQVGLSPFLAILAMLTICIIMYLIAQKCMKEYELI